MSNSTDALAPLPARGSQLPTVAPPRPSFGFTALPPEEPSVLWNLAVRHSRLLAVCGVVSLVVAWVAGSLFARPLWQAEAVLLYRPVQFTAEQLVAYPSPPSLPTLAGWLKEPKFLRRALAECGLKMSPTAFVDQHLKVEQPPGTEVMSVSLKWSDRDSARELLDKLLQQYLDFVAVERKKSIVQGAIQSKRQDWALCQADMQRLESYISDQQEALTRNGSVPTSDLDGHLLTHRNDLPLTESWKNPYALLDGVMIARRGWLEEQILKDEQQLVELQTKYQKELSDYKKHAALAQSGAATPEDVTNFKFLCDMTGWQIKHAEERIKKYTEELRTLPISQAQKMRVAVRGRADFLKDELRQLDAVLLAAQQPETPLVHRVLTGMDAHEFKIESTWIDDQPASTNRRTLSALTFLMLMGLTFGLLFAYDRSTLASAATPSNPGGGPLRTGLVHIASRVGNGVTIARVDVQRLSVRIHQWIRGDEETNGCAPSMMIGPDGQVEEARQLPPAESAPVVDEADHLAARIHHWLERGPGEGK